MPINLKTWLEATGLKVAEDKFIKPPVLPYIVFSAVEGVYGADNSNLLNRRQVTIELYSDLINPAAEKFVEDLLDAKTVNYSKGREWFASESFFQTAYDFEITERK